MLREWRWMMHCHIPKMLMAVKHMNHHFLNITNTTIYFKIETFPAEIIGLWNLFEYFHDNIFLNTRIHDWIDVVLYTTREICVLVKISVRFNCCNMFLSCRTDNMWFNCWSMFLYNRTYSCIYENTKHEKLFLIHLLQNNQEKNKRVVTGVLCMLQHVCVLNQLGGGAAARGRDRRRRGGGGAGASGGPNQRRYSFIMWSKPNIHIRI